jgi:hypothetical protein
VRLHLNQSNHARSANSVAGKKACSTDIALVEQAFFMRWLRWCPQNGNLIASSRSMSKITKTSRDHIADKNFAFPKEHKEPIHDAAHVRNAIARFKQVEGVSDSERDAAWKRIQAAAKEHKVELKEKTWHELN